MGTITFMAIVIMRKRKHSVELLAHHCIMGKASTDYDEMPIRQVARAQRDAAIWTVYFHTGKGYERSS